MNTECRSDLVEFQPSNCRKITAAFDGGRMTSDGGVLLLRELEKKHRIIARLARCFVDHRDPNRIEHSVEELLTQRIFGLICGYPALNDQNQLRYDPAMAAAVGKDDPRGASRPRQRDVGAALASSATAEVDGETITPDIPESRDVNDPGMNYGFGQATAELHRNFSLEAKLILGASDVGFAAGVGGLIRIGRIAGTRLEIGGETVQDIGGLTFFRFAWDTVPRVPMSLTIEINNRPDTNLSPTGTRLIYDIGYKFSDAIEVTGRVGYAARTSGLDAGFVGGLDVSYAF